MYMYIYIYICHIHMHRNIFIHIYYIIAYCIPSGKSLILPETASLMHVVLCIMCRLIDPACWQAPPSAYFLSEVRRV